MKYCLCILAILIFLCMVNSNIYTASFSYNREWVVESPKGIDITHVCGEDKNGRFVIKDNSPLMDEQDQYCCSLCVAKLEKIYDNLLEKNNNSEDPLVTVYICPECKRKYTRYEYYEVQDMSEKYPRPINIEHVYICGFGK